MSSSVSFNNRINSIRAGRQQFQLAPFRAELILAVKNKTADHAAFTVILAAFLLAVDDAVTKLRIVAAKVIKFADKIFLRDGYYLVFALFCHAEQAVKLIAQHGIIAFDFGADITVFAVPADFDIAECRLLTVNFVKVFNFRPAGIILTVFLNKFLQILDRIIIKMRQIPAELFHRIQNLPQFPLVFLYIKPADTPHRQCQKFVNILISNITSKQRTVRCQSSVDFGILLFFTAALLDPFVDTVFKEKLRQRFGMEEFRLTVVFVFKFKIEILQQFFRIADNHIMHCHLRRLAVTDDRHIDRNGNRAIGIHVECLQCLFRIGTAHRHDTDLNIFSRVIIDARNADLVLFCRFFNGGHQTFSCRRRRDLSDNQFTSVNFNFCAQNDFSVSVGIFTGIHESALEEVRIKFKRLPAQCGNLRLQKFVEVVRHDLRRHTHSNTVTAEHKQTGNLYRKNDRFFASAVIGIHKFGNLIRKQHFASQRRKTALNVTRRRSRTAGEDVSEVSLFGDKVLFICQNHHRIPDGSIAVGMIVHGVTDDIRRLVRSAVIHFVQYPENTSLHRLQSVIHIRNRAVLDDVSGIIQKITVHHRPEIGIGIGIFTDGGLSVCFRS